MSEVVGLLLLAGAAVSAWRATHRAKASLAVPGRRDAAPRRPAKGEKAQWAVAFPLDRLVPGGCDRPR